MSTNTYNYNKIYNIINQQEQLYINSLSTFYKLKINFTLKNNEKNKFLFIVNLLLLERASGQRVIFLKEKIGGTKIKPIKIGCSVTLRNEMLYNFWKILILNSFPKLYDVLNIKNKKFIKQKLMFLNFDKFLFFSIFSFFIDFDKFLIYYEDFIYHLNLELYTSINKFLLNRVIFSLQGLEIL